MGFLRKIGDSFTGMWGRREELNLRNIRPGKMQYIISYCCQLMFTNMRVTYLQSGDTLFGIQVSTLTYFSMVILSVAVTLLWSNRFKPLTYISSVIMLGAFFPWLFLQGGAAKSVCEIIFWAGLGGCAAASRFGFGFAANNTERLTGVLLTFFSSSVMYMLKGLGVESVLISYVLPVLLIVGMAVAMYMYKEEDIVANEAPQPTDRRTVLLAMAYMTAVYAADAFLSSTIEINNSMGFVMIGVGGVSVVLLIIAIRVFFKTGIWHMWNLYFAIVITMAVITAVSPAYGLSLPKHFFIGMQISGPISALYMLGGIQKRFSSIKMLKLCTLMLILVVPAAVLASVILEQLVPQFYPLISLAVILGMFTLFLLVSPISHKYLFSADWMEDFRKEDMPPMQAKVEEADRFEQLELTPREREVAALLLSGRTARMVAGELRISEATVNLHTKHLYKKLNINSRAELFARFGVTLSADKQP